RAVRIDLPGTAEPMRWVLAEDETRYRRAFPSGGEHDLGALGSIVRQYLRTHALIGMAELCRRYPIAPELAAWKPLSSSFRGTPPPPSSGKARSCPAESGAIERPGSMICSRPAAGSGARPAMTGTSLRSRWFPAISQARGAVTWTGAK